MKASFVEDRELNLASVAHLPRVRQTSFQGGMVSYLISPKFIKPKLAGSVAKWIAADIARGFKGWT